MYNSLFILIANSCKYAERNQKIKRNDNFGFAYWTDIVYIKQVGEEKILVLLFTICWL